MRKPVNLGHDSSTPLILGYVNDEPARFVEGTGLYLAVRKGDRRWVTGTAVIDGLRSGVLIDVDSPDAPALSAKQLREAAATEPDGATQGHKPPVPADTGLAGLRPATKAAAAKAAPKAAAKKAAPAAKAAPKKAVKKSVKKRA